MKKKSIVTRHRADIGERKDIENAIAADAKRTAILEYIAACDYPEVFEENEEAEENE
ncbi:MAG: hypothetical protein IJP92_08440 [Lachnospiraceae bacterium]|nr:hypothetical protein [Lachnospiraceae bacterium]